MKKSSICPYAMIILFVCGFVSCYPVSNTNYNVPLSRQQANAYYVPTASHAPLLRRKNDYALNLQLAFTTRYNHLEVGGAYAPINHLGIMASAIDGDYNKLKYTRNEVGIGYWTPLTSLLYFETFAGFSSGKVSNHHASGETKFKVHQAFIQPAISLHSAGNGTIVAFVSRFTTSRHELTLMTFDPSLESYSGTQVQSLIDQPKHVYWEPGLSFRFGYEKLVFNLNFTHSKLLSGQDFERENFKFSMGTTIQLNASKKVQKKD